MILMRRSLFTASLPALSSRSSSPEEDGFRAASMVLPTGELIW